MGVIPSFPFSLFLTQPCLQRSNEVGQHPSYRKLNPGHSFRLPKEDFSALVPMDLYGKALIYTGRPGKDFQTMP